MDKILNIKNVLLIMILCGIVVSIISSFINNGASVFIGILLILIGLVCYALSNL